MFQPAPRSAMPLVQQIVAAVQARIDAGLLRPGARLPSIRRFAAEFGVSRFSVVEAYDRLVAQGYLQSRRGAGFYVAARPQSAAPQGLAALERSADVTAQIRRMFVTGDELLKAGCGWLPGDWLDQSGLARQLRALARQPGEHLTGYGHPQGYPPLRQQLARRLEGLGIAATPGQIVLTQGAAQALDLVIRHLLAPGDCVLVDDPGYYNLFGQLRLHGVTLLGVPRHADGPDLAALEALLSAHRPRAFFLQSGLHNPSGGGLAPHIAFRLLALAERHDFLLVEDDSFADFLGQPGQRLATLDQLQRVLYIGGFSKPLSASLRVGFLAAAPPLARELADLKLLTALAGSEGVERAVHGLLTEGYYRKHLERLRARLRQARETTLHRFRALGVELFHEPQDGMFLWARLPGVEDATALAAAAEREGVLLAPGQAFRPDQQPSPWLRFNVAWCQDLRLWRCLARLRETAGG